MIQEEQIKTEEEIKTELENYNGTETFYKNNLFNTIYTTGFKRFLELNKSYWLYSDISIIVLSKFLNKEDFILCKFKVNDDDSCFYSLYSDYNKDDDSFNKKHLLYTQKYDYTDSILKEFEFYICYNHLGGYTFMLKNEY